MISMLASRTVYSFWLCSSLLLGFGACNTSFETEQELNDYILDVENGLKVEKESRGFKLSVMYKPTDLLIAQELGGLEAKTKEDLAVLRKKYEDYAYYILSLSKNDKEALYQADGGYGQFSDLVQTLSFKMGTYVNMTTTATDTIEVADYVFPRTFGLGGASNLMFVFNKEKSLDDAWVQFNLAEFGLGIGRQTFRFKRKDLDNVPKLKFSVKGKQEEQDQ